MSSWWTDPFIIKKYGRGTQKNQNHLLEGGPCIAQASLLGEYSRTRLHPGTSGRCWERLSSVSVNFGGDSLSAFALFLNTLFVWDFVSGSGRETTWRMTRSSQFSQKENVQWNSEYLTWLPEFGGTSWLVEGNMRPFIFLRIFRPQVSKCPLRLGRKWRGYHVRVSYAPNRIIRELWCNTVLFSGLCHAKVLLI